MWQAACLWVEMGVGWGRTPFSEHREHHGVEGLSKMLEILEPAVGWRDGNIDKNPHL